MAQIGELSVLIKLKGANQFQNDLKGIQKNLTALSSTLGQVERASRTLGVALTGTFTAAFTVAAKSLPKTDTALKDFKKSTEELSKTLAIAATPALNDLTKGINKLSNALKTVNPQIIENSFRFGLALLAVSAFAKTLKTVIDLLRVSLRTVWGQWGLVLAGIAISIKVITDNMTSLQQKLRAFATGGFAGLGALFTGARGGIFSKDFSDKLNETTDALGRFVRGFKDHFKTLAENAETFGRQIAQSLEDAFSNTLFDAITGRLKGLRSILIALGEDILRSGIRSLTNTLFNTITKGFNFGKKDPLTNLKDKADEVSEKFAALSINMDRFAQAKDRAIAALQRGASQGVPGGAVAGPLGFAASTIAPISPDTLKSAGLLSVIFGLMAKNVQSVVANISNIGKEMIKAMSVSVIAFRVAQAAMVALSAMGALLMVAIGTSAANALFNAWLPAAIAASIATLGGAAAIGSAAVTAAFPLTKALVAPFEPKSGSGELPAGAGITMGAGGVEGLAEGGIVRKPGIFMVGESGPEAVVPLDQVGMNGGSVTIVSDIIFADDPSSVDRLIRTIKDGMIRASNRRTGGTQIAF